MLKTLLGPPFIAMVTPAASVSGPGPARRGRILVTGGRGAPLRGVTAAGYGARTVGLLGSLSAVAASVDHVDRRGAALTVAHLAAAGEEHFLC